MTHAVRNALIAAVVFLTPLTVHAQDQAPPATSAPVSQVITLTRAANLRDLADKAGYDGHTPASFTFVVPAKLNLLGSPGGGRAIDTGKWPEGVTLALVIDGNVYGGGGNGGDGGDSPGPGYGGHGGDAIYCQAPIAITLSAGGTIKAGGGGGGGGAGPVGSGGGGGFPNGQRGEAGNGRSDTYIFVQPGHPGSPSGGGLGGRGGGTGGDGGDTGKAGTAAARPGGEAGDAIRTNGFAVTLARSGDIWGVVE